MRPDPSLASHRRPEEAGFGLLEAILALAIAGLVLAVITEIAGRTLRSWNAGLGTVAAIERTELGLARLAADLAALVPMHLATAEDEAVLFTGDERGMSFTALTPIDRTTDGLAVIEIGIETTGDGGVLVRRLRRGRDAGLRDGDRVVLISGRVDLAFSYRDRTGQRHTRWTGPGEVPSGVMVTLVGTRRGGGLPVEVFLPIPTAIPISCLVGAEPAVTTTTPAGSASTDARARRCATGPRGIFAPPPQTTPGNPSGGSGR
jgi:general secretion pathway protein J